MFTALIRGVTAARTWFRAFRRTRPFWGGLWLVLAGVVVVRFMLFPLGLAVSGGFNTSAGYILGGALVMFGLVAWFAPHYSAFTGILGVMTALAAFVGANLGGFLLGSLLGILGGSMVWGWGDLTPSDRRRRSRARRAARSSSPSGRARVAGTGRIETQPPHATH